MNFASSGWLAAARLSTILTWAMTTTILAPLLIAGFVVSETYAAMVFAFALAPFIAPLLGAGNSSSAAPTQPPSQPRSDQGERHDASHGAVALLLLGGICALVLDRPEAALCAMAAATYCLGLAFSAVAGGAEHQHFPNWLHGLPEGLFFLAAGMTWFAFGSWFTPSEATMAWGAIAAFLLVVLARRRDPLQGGEEQSRFGANGRSPILRAPYGLVLAASLNFGLLAFGLFAQPWDLAAYAIALRFAGVITLIQLAASIVGFQKTETPDADEIDSALSILLLAIAICGIGVCIVGPTLLATLELKALTADRHGILAQWMPVIGAHLFLLTATQALAASQIRADLQKRFVWTTLAITLAGASGLVWLDSVGLASPINILTAAAGVTAAILSAMFLALWKSNQKFPRTGIAILSGTLPYMML